MFFATNLAFFAVKSKIKNMKKTLLIILILPLILGIYLIVKPDKSNVVRSEVKKNVVVVIDLKKDKAFPINKIIGVVLVLSSMFFAYYFYNKTNRLLAEKENNTPQESLTIQESKICKLIKMKYSNKEIATELNISVSTVKTHVNNIYKKLGISSRKELFNG